MPRQVRPSSSLIMYISTQILCKEFAWGTIDHKTSHNTSPRQLFGDISKTNKVFGTIHDQTIYSVNTIAGPCSIFGEPGIYHRFEVSYITMYRKALFATNRLITCVGEQPGATHTNKAEARHYTSTSQLFGGIPTIGRAKFRVLFRAHSSDSTNA